ncbi:MAG: tetratricopeptide repeat protein, partial [Spirochaetota bacterium]
MDIRLEIAGLTDADVPVATPRSLARGQRLAVELLAPIAASVLEAGEGSTAQMRVSFSYRRGSERREEVVSRQIRVLNRNAIQWSDDLRIGAFMSVSQSDLLSWAGRVAGALELAPTAALSRNLLYAIQLFEALGQAGIRYVIDPNSAYESLSEDRHAIDYLRFPNETLAFGAGDCDDLSVLYATLLESVGVATAFITTPGHILIAFDTGVAPHDSDRIFDSTERLIVRQGTVWMPVETTELARGFTAAWLSGATQWNTAAQAGTAGFFTAREAWAAYPPAGPRTDAPVPEPDLDGTTVAARRELEAYRQIELEPKLRRLVGSAEDATRPAIENRIGILHATYGLFDEALNHFRSAAAGGYVPALVNEANVLSLRGLHSQAQSVLERARKIEPANARVLLGLAAVYRDAGDESAARIVFEQAGELDSSLTLRFPLFDPPADPAANRSVDPAESSGRAGVEGSLLFADWVDE